MRFLVLFPLFLSGICFAQSFEADIVSCCCDPQDFKEALTDTAELFLAEQALEQDVYQSVINQFNRSYSSEESDSLYHLYIPLLDKVFWKVIALNRHCASYFFEERISRGRLYFTYNVSDGFLTELLNSDDKLLKEYAESVIASGDIAPTLSAGFGKWPADINENSPLNLRMVFLMHLVIMANKGAHGG